MKYIKTFETFKVDETLDMFTLPVDPMKGAGEVYSDIADALGGKFKEALDKLDSVADSVVEELGSKAHAVKESVERYFGVPAEKLTYDLVVGKLKSSNESFVDRYDAADPYDGHGETSTTPIDNVKGGPIQKIGAMIQRICEVNLLFAGGLGTFVTWLMSLFDGGDAVNFAMSFVYSIVAWIIVHIVRKIDAMA